MKRLSFTRMLILISCSLFLGCEQTSQHARLTTDEAPGWATGPETEPSRIRLIIRGDDFGITHSSNMALEKAFDARIMTSASVMSSAPWFTETAAMVRDNPDWSIGLHLTISNGWDRLGWAPLVTASEVPSLVAENGNFYLSFPDSPLGPEFIRNSPYLYSSDVEMSPDVLERRQRLTSNQLPNLEEVEIELRAQIERALNHGIRIDYLDCHMGVVCHPELRPVLIKLAEELGLPIPELGWLGTIDVWETYNGDVTSQTEKFVAMLDGLEPGNYRIVLHPTVDTLEVHASDSYFGPKTARAGQHDLDILTSPEVQAAITRNSIELVSIRELWDYQLHRARVAH